MSRRLHQATSVSLLNSGAVTQSFQLLVQIAEASNLAILKGFAGVAHLILETCQTATTNRTQAIALAQDIGQLAMVVASQVEQYKLEMEADTELLDQISKLCLELEAVHSVIKNLFRRDSFTWFVKHSQDEVRLQRLQRDIKHAVDLFSVQSSFRLQKDLIRSEKLDSERKGRILDEIRAVCQLVVEEMKISKPGAEEVPSKVLASCPVLPRMPRHLCGRAESVNAVVAALIGPAAGRVAILGSAGIGKTSVATMVLFDARVDKIFGTNRYFVSCDAAQGKDDLLTSIAGVLGLQGDTLQKKILDCLGDADNRKLIVLDNFESPWEASATAKKDVEGVLASLFSLENLDVVITMRGSERPGGVQWSRPFLPQLGPLDLPYARKTFLALSDCAEDDPCLDTLLIAIDCVPLAVALMANLAETDSAENLLFRWREEHSSLLHRTPDPRSSLDVSIQMSLNSPRMKAVPEALTLLSLLSLLPDGVDNAQLGVIFSGIAKPRQALSALWKTSLAYNDGHNRTRVLSPVRAYMRLYHSPDTMSLTSMFAYYMGLAALSSSLGGPHGQVIVKRLTPEIGNLHSIVNFTLHSTEEPPEGQPLSQAAVTAAIDLAKFFRFTHLGNPETLQLASFTAKQMQDRVLQADVLYHLARATLTSDSGPECERLCKEALWLYEETGNVDGRAECTWLLGQIYKGGERQKESKGLYEQALALATESQNRYCQGKCLLCLSEMSFHAGDAATAELVGQQALQLFREVENLMNVGMALAWLGRLAIFRNDGTAEATLDEAAEVFKQAGAPYQLGRIFLGKGDSAIARCDFHAAREAYNKAVALHQETGSLKSNLGAFAQVSLGTATAYLYDYAEARRWLDAASHTFEKTKTNVAAYGKLHCDMIRGDLAFYEENFTEALTLYQRALLAAESRGFQEEEAQCRVKIGTMAFHRGRPQEGLQYLVVAAVTQRRISDVKGLSQTLVRLGRFFEASGDKNMAVLLFQTAYPLCRKMEGLRDVADCLLGLGTLFQNIEQVMEAAALYRKTGDTKGLDRCTAALATMSIIIPAFEGIPPQ